MGTCLLNSKAGETRKEKNGWIWKKKIKKEKNFHNKSQIGKNHFDK